jgi:hypothetical protein
VLRNYFLLNLLLLLIIGVLGVKFYNIIANKTEIPSEASVKGAQKVDKGIPSGNKNVNEGEFNKISDLDLFRPSRSAPAEEAKQSEVSPMKDPPKLFGTIIFDSNRTAILEDPETKTTKAYRLGDMILGYTISDISESKVVLTRDGDDVVVKLRDDKGVKTPVRTVQPGISTPSPVQRQVQTPGSPVQRRARPVPPRRRPARVRPPAAVPQQPE